jgi:hypothetical protein
MTDFKYQHLLQQHLDDLKTVCPSASDVFICPICLQVFTIEKIRQYKTDLVNLGHVWPTGIQQIADNVTKHQQVLLCNDCNSRAGSHGDSAMQIVAEIREAQKRGETVQPRKVVISPYDLSLDAIDQALSLRRPPLIMTNPRLPSEPPAPCQMPET